MTTGLTVAAVDSVDCVLEPRPWPFAEERAVAIATHWAEARRAKPKLFDGRVLLQHRGGIEIDPDGRRVFRGAYLETRFSAFLAWRDFGFPPAGVRNGFGMAALSSADGAFVLGEMAAHTANAGKIYFASGTPDPSDLRDDQVDIAASVRRELLEETGLGAPDVAFDPGFTVVSDDLRVAFLKRVRSPEPAETLVRRIEAFLAREDEPELARIHLIRTRADIGPTVPHVVAAYLATMLGSPQAN